MPRACAAWLPRLLLPVLLLGAASGAHPAEPPSPGAARAARLSAALGSREAARRKAALAELAGVMAQDAALESRLLPLLGEVLRLRAEDERALAAQALARATTWPGQQLWFYAALDERQPEPVLRAAIDGLQPGTIADALLTLLLEAASDKARPGTQRALALEALGQAGATAADLRLREAREGADWVEESGRALGLARRGGPRALGALVELMGHEDACPRVHAWEGLRRLTGEPLPPAQEPWAAWWRAQREKAGTAGPAAPGEDPDGRYAHPEGAHQPRFYGIPIPRKPHGTRVVFCCDTSHSMQGPPLDRARRELLATLKDLSSEDRFGLVAFHEQPLAWSPRLVRAHPVQKVRAVDWFLALEPMASTNVHDSLERAFGMGGRGRQAVAGEPPLDALFLLTDGEPNVGRFTRASDLLREVRAWAQPATPLHAVGASQDAHVLLRALAEATGGTFVDGSP